MLLDGKPSYDGLVIRDWKWGIEDLAGSVGGYYTGLSGTTSAWLAGLLPFQGLTAGVTSLVSLAIQQAFTQIGDLDQAVVQILRRDGAAAGFGTYSRLAEADVLSQITRTGSTVVVDVLTPDEPLEFEVTQDEIDAGQYYAVSMLLHGPNGRTAAHPGMRRLNPGYGPRGWWWDGIAGDAIPTVLTESTASGSYVLLPYMRSVLRSTRRQMFRIANPITVASGKLLVPRPASALNLHCVLRDMITPAGETQTITHQRWVANSRQPVALATCTVNMGVSDKITFDRTDVELVNNSEAGKKIDIDILIRPLAGSTRGNVGWVNKEYAAGPTAPGAGSSDIAFISHGAAAIGRGQDYQLDAAAGRHADWIEIARSGTGTIASLEIATRLHVLFGDSQAADKITGVAQLQRLGLALANALTDPLPWFVAGISGNRLRESVSGNHTAGYLRYRSAVAGQGDWCDWHSLLFSYCGMGVNVISASVAAAGDDLKIAQGLAARLLFILADLFENDNAKDNQAILVGLPFWSGTTELKQASIQLFNQTIVGAALAAVQASLQPYDLTYANIATWLDGGGLHYTTTGAQAVAALVAANYEASRIHAPGFGSNWF